MSLLEMAFEFVQFNNRRQDAGATKTALRNEVWDH
jgi:hypothetical protein